MKHGLESDAMDSAKRQKTVGETGDEPAKSLLQERFETLKAVRLSKRILRTKELEDKEESDEGEDGRSGDENGEYEDEDGEYDEDEDEDGDGDEDEDGDGDEEDAYDDKDLEGLLALVGVSAGDYAEYADGLDAGENERRRLLVESLDATQLSRYECFRRTTLNAGGVKKLVNAVVGGSGGAGGGAGVGGGVGSGAVGVGGDFARLVGGVGKVFVGEIVERAKAEQRCERAVRGEKETEREKERGDQLRPDHIARAWASLCRDNSDNNKGAVVVREWRGANRRGLF